MNKNRKPGTGQHENHANAGRKPDPSFEVRFRVKYSALKNGLSQDILKKELRYKKDEILKNYE